MISTLGSLLPSAVVCRQNGWEVGCLLRGEPLPGEVTGPRFLLLTAVGASLVLGVAFDSRGDQVGRERLIVNASDREVSAEAWELSVREWRLVHRTAGLLRPETMKRVIRDAAKVTR